MLDMAEKQQEIMNEVMLKQLELEAERRKEVHTIEGVVVKTEMAEKTVVTKFDSETKKEIEELKAEFEEIKKTPGAKIEGDFEIKEKVETVKVCVVTFEDGREKEFAKVPAKPFVKGDYYIIEYNGMDEITMVTRDNNGRSESDSTRPLGEDTTKESEVGNP
jgi:hypothetical protein